MLRGQKDTQTTRASVRRATHNGADYYLNRSRSILTILALHDLMSSAR